MGIRDFFTVAVSLVFLGSLVYFVGIDEISLTISRADISLLVLAVLIQCAVFVLWNLKLKLLVGKIKKISFLSLFPILMTGSFIKTTTYGVKGGSLSKTYPISKHLSKKKSEVYASILVDRTTNSLAFTFFTFFSLLFVVLFLNIEGVLKIFMEIIVLVFVLVFFSGYIERRNLKKLIKLRSKTPEKFLEKYLLKVYNFRFFRLIRTKFRTYTKFEEYIIQRFENFFSSFETLVKDKKLLRRDLFLAFIIWTLIYIKCYVIFLSMGFDPGFATAVVVVTLSIFISSALMLPWSLGIIEILMITLYAASGIEPALATAVALIDRVILYIFTFGIGFLSFFYTQFRYIGK